ncbi:DUF4426 domain-containing protein [Gynuella sp.]|uniref:DUF4426 domain-containing protein n=1 Tax=Gynuella sp. TaxID=2969146 RepID=UPI003D0D9D14
MKHLLTILTLLCASLSVQAAGEQKQVFGRYEVHYMMLNSTTLSAEIARSYQLQRSGKLGFLMVSVLENKEGEDLPHAVPAMVSARIKNLIGQERDIELREIQEQGGIYYVGNFNFDDEDIYRFEIDVKAEPGQDRPFTVRHQQQMYFE